MPSENAVLTYWLMPGDTPQEPYPVEEILQQIQAGTCTWTTKASLVGSQSWMPLNQLLTLAPVAQVAPANAPVGTPPNATHAPGWSPSEKLILLTVVLIACWCAWTFFFSDTNSSRMSPQREVCQKLVETKNVNDAMKLVTPNLYSSTQAMFALPDSAPNSDDKLDLLDEEPALPQHGGGFYVGYRMQTRDNQDKIVIEGVFHVVNQSGWKVHDWYVCKGNGQNIEPPISMAREYMYFFDPQNVNLAQRTNTDSKQQVKQCYDKNLVRWGSAVLAKPGLGKGVMLVIGAIVMGIYGYFSQRSSSTTKS